MKAPRSLRARLIASVLAALAVAAAALGALTYRSALHETEELFDYQLRQMALSLRDQGEIAPGDAAALNDDALDFVVQIWTFDGRSVYASRDHRSLPSRAVIGFADIVVDGERWRTFSSAARGRVIQVAQPQRIRQRLAARSAFASMWPLLAVAPLLALVMGGLIARTLAPLRRLATELRAQDAATLSPLGAADLPDEVQPMVAALNALLQRLREALAGQRAFVADAAHELRSPLTALKLQAQVLQRTPPGEAREAALTALVAGVDRAARLVEQLLALARSEPGARSEGFAPVDLAALAREVLADAAPLAAARGSTLSLDVPDAADAAGATDRADRADRADWADRADRADRAVGGDRPDPPDLIPARCRVAGDAAGLATLLRNLVDNALRYTPPGGRIALGLQPQGARWRLTVDDSGPGIPPAQREAVFERFVRGAAAAGETGSGLGLAIVRSEVQRHRGSVALGDSPLGGLRVTIELPAAA